MFSPAVISARWRDVAIVSWQVEDACLDPFVPNGLALDHWQGTAYISLVCLFMDKLRVLGLPALPRRFAEVNLRFYVRPSDARDNRQGVVFLRQLVSNPFVAFAGRHLFREPMRATQITRESEAPEPVNGRIQRRVQYCWRDGDHDEALRITACGNARLAEPGSLEEFLTHRHWGYNGKSGRGLRAYRIARNPWPLLPVVNHELVCYTSTPYKPEIADVMAGPPASALLALGSHSRVHWPTKLR